MTSELKKWLYTECANEDLLELKEGVFYMPIGVVKKKIQYMEDTFGVAVLESNFHHFFFNNNQRESIVSGSIGITLMQRTTITRTDNNTIVVQTPYELITQLIGAATFPISFYGENTHYAATLESLCIVNAFGGKYPQFGSALNKFDVVPADKGLAKVPKQEVDKEINKLFEQVKKKLSKYSNQEDAQAYLDSTEFKHSLIAKNIVNSLPKKS
jgi:hypothetical protein